MARLALYLRITADMLGLRDHEVKLLREPATPGRIAECDVTAYRQAIHIRVGNEFLLMSASQQRHAVVHELLHAHFTALCSTVEQGVPAWMPGKTYEMFHGMFERDLEVVVDTMTVLLCPLVDVPRLEDET